MGNFIITAEAGGPSSGGGSGGTAPDAPAVIASWISGVEPIYLRYGNAWKVSGFQGTITPPSGTDCTYLQQIHVTAKSPDGAKSEISVPGPFAESTAVQFAVGTDYLLEADATFTLSFASENDDSKLTAPYNLTYIVHAATITLLAGADAWSGSGVPTTSQRWKDSSGAVHGVITATVSASKYPFTFRLWADPQNGKAPKYHGLFVVDGPGQVFTLGLENSATIIYPPTTGNENWKLIAAPFSSSQQDDLVPTSPTPFSSVPFVMHAPSAYPSNISPNPTVTTTVYNPVGGGASGYHFQVRFWLPLTDPNFKHGRLYRTGGHYATAGNPDTFTAGGTAAVRTSIGDWAGPTATGYTVIDHAACFTLESTVEAGWIIATLGPEWGTVASDGNNVIRLELGVALRLDSGGTDATETIVTTWPGGLDHYDVVLDPTKSLIDPSLLNPTKFGPNIKINDLGLLDATATEGPNLIDNPGFESGTQGWTLYDNGMGMHFQSDATINHTTLGSRCLEVNALVNGANCGASQRKSIIGDRTYSFHVWHNADGGAAFNVQVVIWYYAADGTYLTLAVVGGGVEPLGSGWQRLGGTFKAPSNAAIGVFGIQVSCSGGSGNLHFDDAEAYLLPAIAGPLYTDVAGNVNLKIANDFVVDGSGNLTQNIVDLAKASNFGTEFMKSGGLFIVNAIAVNKLVAGDALFAGDATFARVGGGKVTINSAGVAIADNLTTPTATVTVTATGATVAKGTNSVQITSSGVAIYGPSGTLSATSTGIVISNGSSSVTVKSTAVEIVNGSFAVTQGTTTVNVDGYNHIRVFDTAANSTCQMTAGLVQVLGNTDYAQAALQYSAGLGLLRLTNADRTVVLEIFPTKYTSASAGPAGYFGAKLSGINVRIPYYPA